MSINKPRLLMVCTLPPPVHGSAMVSQYIKDSELINGVFEMDFVNLSTSRQMSEIGKKSYTLYFKKLFRFLRSYFRCLWLLLTHRYALCYCAITCHGVGFLKDSPFVLLCKLFGHKIVIHQHNKGMSADLDKWPYKWFTPFVYKNCKVMLLSWRLYPDVEKVVKKEDVMICPNGIPPIEGLEVRGERLENKTPKLLYLSNLIVSKGVYVLLDACKILKDKGIAFTCDFVGGESKEISREVFEAAVHERELDEKVVYHGPKYGENKEAFWNSADLFVFPTFYYNETFGLVNLEAMQHEIPVVSTDEGGIPDVVRHLITGVIAKSKDSNDLAEKLEILINDSELRIRLGKKGKEVYNEEYTLEAFEKCLLKCLNSLVGGVI